MYLVVARLSTMYCYRLESILIAYYWLIGALLCAVHITCQVQQYCVTLVCYRQITYVY